MPPKSKTSKKQVDGVSTPVKKSDGVSTPVKKREGGSCEEIFVERPTKCNPKETIPSSPQIQKRDYIDGKDDIENSTPQRKLNQADDDQIMTTKKHAFGSPIRLAAPVDKRVEKVYKIVRKCTGSLGGNGSTGAIYGELTVGSMQKVVNILVQQCDMDSTSRFIDIGSGLGKPNFHASQYPAVRLSLGIELEEIRWQVWIQFLETKINSYHVDLVNCSWQ